MAKPIKKSSKTDKTLPAARWEEKSPARAESKGAFTAGELGAPDEEADGHTGPLGMEGEGDRQNSQLAELEEIPPKDEPEEEDR